MTGTEPPSAAADAVSAAESARFGEALARLLPGGGRIGLAVSGGPDSMAMLLLAQAAIPGEFEVATVDHGLRAESAAETAFVANICADLGAACEILKVHVGAGNKQHSARIARYAALTQWAERCDLAAIATAHHVDDQAETLLMRLNRGSGSAGLAGIRERGTFHWSKVQAVRPLLGWRRAELVAIIARAGIEAVRDPSNADESFDRVRIRNGLAEATWIDVEALARSASHLADAEEGLRHYEQMLLAEHGYANRDLAGISRPDVLTREGQLRLVGWALAERGRLPRGGEVARLVDELRAGRGGNVGGVLVTVEDGDWTFRPEPPRRG